MATKSDKIWADAVRKAVHQYEVTKDVNGKAKKTRYLNVLAAQLVQSAAAGDMQAMKEVGDRLDGKPAQAIDVTKDVTVSYVTQMPEVIEDSEEWHKQYAPKTIQ
jgi:hypothetical protein